MNSRQTQASWVTLPVMANTAKAHGPTGSRVAANVREVRRDRGLSLDELSQRLAEAGHPIGVTTLSKLELDQRRVDVDDLVALAVTLDVSPNRLLLTGTATDEPLPLTSGGGVSEAKAWRWASGERPLDHDPERPGQRVHSLQRYERFPEENRPHDPPDRMLAGELLDRDRRGELQPLREGYLAARAAGVPPGAVRTYLDLVDILGFGGRVPPQED